MATGIISPSFAEKVVKGLRKAADEIEEFSVQASLGKMEGRDLFEKVKKTYRSALHDSVVKIEKAKEITRDNYQKLKVAADELKVQLALGKAETRDLYEDQSKKIRRAVANFQAQMKKSRVPEKYANEMNNELKKLKIKLDILKLKYKQKGMADKNDLRLKKREFRDRLKLVRDRFAGRKKQTRWQSFNDEIGEAWTHLKKAFTTA